MQDRDFSSSINPEINDNLEIRRYRVSRVVTMAAVLGIGLTSVFFASNFESNIVQADGPTPVPLATQPPTPEGATPVSTVTGSQPGSDESEVQNPHATATSTIPVPSPTLPPSTATQPPPTSTMIPPTATEVRLQPTPTRTASPVPVSTLVPPAPTEFVPAPIIPVTAGDGGLLGSHGSTQRDILGGVGWSAVVGGLSGLGLIFLNRKKFQGYRGGLVEETSSVSLSSEEKRGLAGFGRKLRGKELREYQRRYGGGR